MAGKPWGDPAERRKRRALIERRMLSGVRSPNELAAAFGMSRRGMQIEMQRVQESWKNSPLNGGDLDEIRERHVRELYYVMALAKREFVKSCKPKEEVTITRMLCPDCLGSQKDEVTPGEFVVCGTCLGEGRVLKEVTKLSEQTGNAAYLKLMKDCVEVIGKFDATIKPESTTRMGIFKSSTEVGGHIEERVMAVFDGAADDQVIKILSVYDELEREYEGVIDTVAVEG